LRAALEHTDLLALERGTCRELDVVLDDDLAGRVVVLVGEVDLFQAVFGDRHRADDDVVFFGLQAGDHAVPDLFDEYALAFDLFADRVGNVDVKTGGFAVGVLKVNGS
jgi:hypothetical protein